MDDRWTDRLSEYLDGELAGGDRAELEAHLTTCADCRELLEELREVVRSAAALPDEPPAHELWAGIEARLEPRAAAAADTKVISLATRRRHFSFTLPQLAAASIALVAGSSGLVWFLLNGTGRAHMGPVASGTPPAAVVSGRTTTVAANPPVSGDTSSSSGSQRATPEPGSPVLASGPTERQAQERPTSPRVRLAKAPLSKEARATRDYNRAVADLESVLRKERSRLRPETVKALEGSLADIDRAIAEARRALARDPANVYLNAHLAESMRLKLELLQQATTITQS